MANLIQSVITKKELKNIPKNTIGSLEPVYKKHYFFIVNNNYVFVKNTTVINNPDVYEPILVLFQK